MKIFKQSFVGINHTNSSGTTAPLGYLVPYEDNAAGKKREESVTNWLHGSWYHRQHNDSNGYEKETKIIPNTPITGFKIVDWKERYSTSNKVARVADPNGFELEISMANLVALMHDTVIDHGEVKAECVWAREGSDNWLLPIGSDVYNRALKEGETIKASPGDVIEDHKGNKFQYLGRGTAHWITFSGPVETQSKTRGYYREEMISRTAHHFAADNKPKHMYRALQTQRELDHFGEKIEMRTSPMKVFYNHGYLEFDWDQNTIFTFSSGVYFDATGKIREPNPKFYSNKGIIKLPSSNEITVSFDEACKALPSC